MANAGHEMILQFGWGHGRESSGNLQLQDLAGDVGEAESQHAVPLLRTLVVNDGVVHPLLRKKADGGGDHDGRTSVIVSDLERAWLSVLDGAHVEVK